MNKIAKNLDGKGLKVGIVLSRFNADVGDALLKACEAKLLELGVAANDITLATVPGALETPVVLQTMANSENFDAFFSQFRQSLASGYILNLSTGISLPQLS